MYVLATVELDGERYQFGADVDLDERAFGLEVGEPDVSAPLSLLDKADWKRAVNVSSLVDHEVLPEGWSDEVQHALVLTYLAKVKDDEDARADYLFDLGSEDCEPWQ